MIINENIQKLIQFRIEQEEYSARIYLAMSKWLVKQGYFGAAKLWEHYSNEELKHAGWAYSYLEDLDLLPSVCTIDEPDTSFTSLQSIIEISTNHEVVITNQCNDLAKKCLAEGDLLTFTLAQKYLTEQVEEVAKMTYWTSRITAFGTESSALRELDEEMEESLEN